MPKKERKILAIKVSKIYFRYGRSKTKNLEKKPFVSAPFSKFEVGCTRKTMPVHF